MLRGKLKELNLAYPPQVLQLEMGDICRVTTHFNYRGPAISATLYVAIGVVAWYGFDELVHKSKSLSLPATDETKTYESYVDISITSPLKVGTYDVYAKLMQIPGYPDVFSPTYENIIEILEVAPPPVEYSLEVTVEPPGTGSVTVSPLKTVYSAGEKVTLTASPASGYEFDYWGGWQTYPEWGSTSRTIAITMDSDKWVVAAFREIEVEQYELWPWFEPNIAWLKVNNEWWYGEPLVFPKNAVVKVEAVITDEWAPYYKFWCWVFDGSTRYYNPATTIMTKDKWAACYFREK